MVIPREAVLAGDDERRDARAVLMRQDISTFVRQITPRCADTVSAARNGFRPRHAETAITIWIDDGTALDREPDTFIEKRRAANAFSLQ